MSATVAEAPTQVPAPLGMDQDQADSLAEFIHKVMYDRFAHFLSDVEFRVAQAYDIERRGQRDLPVTAEQRTAGIDRIYAEDLVLMRPFATGYTVTNNSPTNGQIAWSALHIVYNGVDNTITDGNLLTTEKYAWWDPTTPTVLQKSATKPTLATQGQALIFMNNAGIAVDVLQQTIPKAIGDNAVDSGSILAGAVVAGKLGTDAVVAANILDGAVGSAEIGSGAVIAGKIATGAISSSTLFTSGVVDSTAIGSGAVIAGKLGTASVVSTNLGAGAVTASKLTLLEHFLY